MYEASAPKDAGLILPVDSSTPLTSAMQTKPLDNPATKTAHFLLRALSACFNFRISPQHFNEIRITFDFRDNRGSLFFFIRDLRKPRDRPIALNELIESRFADSVTYRSFCFLFNKL